MQLRIEDFQFSSPPEMTMEGITVNDPHHFM